MYTIKDIEIDYIKKSIEALEVNPNIKVFFDKTDDGKIVLNLNCVNVGYNYKKSRVGDRFYVKSWKGYDFTWKCAVVTYKRSGAMFYKYADSKNEICILEDSIVWDHIYPYEVHIDNKDIVVKCECPKTKIIYK